MNIPGSLKGLWRSQGITAKFGLAFSLLLALLLIEAVISFTAMQSVRTAGADIRARLEIRQLVFEMDGLREKARRLQRDFFLHYPEIGFSKAEALYFAPAQQTIGQVVALSDKLRTLVAEPGTSETLRQRNTDINLYLSTARRFPAIFEELVRLVTALAAPGTGLQSQLRAKQAALGALAAENREAKTLHREMTLFEHEYWLSRQRPAMQSALNVGFQLGKALEADPALPPAQKAAARELLAEYGETAMRILDLDVAIRGKLNDLALQAKAVDPISEDLKNLATADVERSRSRIKRAGIVADVTFAGMTLTVLAFALVIARLIHSSITRRIVALTGSAEALRQGDLDARVQAGGGDEIGELAATFNDMAARIKDLVANLEANVSTRTAELSAARDELQAAVAALDEKNQTLEVLSRTDRLTGIGNRRRLEESLQAEVLRARRYGKPFSVIMADVDRFKAVNDIFGHQVGDTVLAEVAGMLARGARETDVVGRWGGEEFLLLCPETSLGVGAALAERLRQNFEAHTFPEVGQVTVSFGVTCYQSEDSPQTLVLRADEALYKAKEAGRNRVESA